MKIIFTIFTHFAALVLSFIALGALHQLSDRGIFAILKASYEVRWMSIYFLDVIPIYFAFFLLLSLFLAKKRYAIAASSIGRIWIALLALIPTVVLHQWLFPVSLRSILLLVLYSMLHACTLNIIQGILLILNRGLNRRGVLRSVISSIMIVVTLSVVYVGAFRVAYTMGLAPEAETFKSSKVLEAAVAQPGNTLADQFRLVDLGFNIKNFDTSAIVDFDRDGNFDLVVRDTGGRLRLWLNKEAGWIENPDLLPDLNYPINAYSFADSNGNGLLDLLLTTHFQKPESAFENTFLKYIYWYPWPKPAHVARLLRQLEPGEWRDETASAFPDETPWAYRKVEPIVWFDANQDGRLDIIWSGYPHPRKSMNKLYLAKEDYSYQDGLENLLTWEPGRIYPEGTDVADIDGDGDLDLFAYGYPFLNIEGKFVQICGIYWAGIPCDAEARIDEGGVFEDVDGDGRLELIISYHGTDHTLKKYTLALFRLVKGSFNIDERASGQVYGFHTYLTGKDVNGDGRSEILTQLPGRLLQFTEGKWLDVMPLIYEKYNKNVKPIGWLDAGRDGDWDILARTAKDRIVLIENILNPSRALKIIATGENGEANQAGATVRITLPSGQVRTSTLRPSGGYNAVTDPGFLMPLKQNGEYFIELCFASLNAGAGLLTERLFDGGIIKYLGLNEKQCRIYNMTISNSNNLINLQLGNGINNHINVVTTRLSN